MENLGKVLVVDDNEDVLFALNLLLEPYAEKIRVAKTPEKIEFFMKEYLPDIILLDMNFRKDAISGQEGFEWLGKILTIWSVNICASIEQLVILYTFLVCF
jgi:CheY-like chemotaxis protein